MPGRRLAAAFFLHRARFGGGCGARRGGAGARGAAGGCAAAGRTSATAGWMICLRRAVGTRQRARGAEGAAACRVAVGVRAVGRSGAAGGMGRVPAFHCANRLSSAASIGAIRRRNSRPSSSPSQPPDISPARAPFSPVKGLEAGDVFIVRRLVNNQDRVKGLFAKIDFFSPDQPTASRRQERHAAAARAAPVRWKSEAHSTTPAWPNSKRRPRTIFFYGTNDGESAASE